MTSSSPEKPHVPLVERAVLSLMMRDSAFRRRALGDGLKAEHFWTLRPVFDAIVALARAGSPVDAPTLSAWLDRDKRIMEVGGHAGVLEIANYGAIPDNWSQHLTDLRSSHARRIAVESAAWMASATDGEEALEAAKAAMDGIKAAITGPSRSKTAKQAAKALINWMQLTALAGKIPGIPTGMHDLDLLTGGMRPGQLWVVLAQTSGGKSVLMQQLALEALLAARRTSVFSIEMMVHEVMARFVSRYGRQNLSALFSPATMTKQELEKAEAMIRLLSEMPLTIDDTPGMTLSHIDAEAHRLADAHGGLGLVLVDYLQIVRAETRKGGSREEAVASISGGLKQLAKALGCPVVTGAQLNRQNSVRESDAISFDADVVLMIAEDGIKVAKNRNGRRNDVLRYELVGELQSFVPFDPEVRAEEQAAADKAAEEEEKRRRNAKGGRDRQYRG
jgi:replicative DNA helicase